jgi:hypothetical protein
MTEFSRYKDRIFLIQIEDKGNVNTNEKSSLPYPFPVLSDRAIFVP